MSFAIWMFVVVLGASMLGAALGIGLARLQYPLIKPRPLDCGCPRDGRPEYGCLYCGHARCAEHRDDEHDLNHSPLPR